MKLTYLLISEFLLVSILVGVVGFFGLQTLEKTQQSSELLTTADQLLGQYTTKEAVMGEVISSTSLSRLNELEERLNSLDTSTKRLSAELLADAEIRSNDDFQAFLREQQKINVIQEEILALRREKLEQANVFSENSAAEDLKRSDIAGKLYQINDITLTKQLGLMQTYSKTAQFQHRDQQHVDEWINSITTVRNRIISLGLSQSLVDQLNSYEDTAKAGGNSVVQQTGIEKRESLKIAELKSLNSELGVLQDSVALDLRVTSRQAFETNKLLFTFAIVVVVIMSIVISLFVSPTITKSLEKITKVVDDVSKGKLDVQLETSSSIDEVNKLAESLDRVLTTMKRSIKRMNKKE